jgi:hypothetical protein
MELSTSSEAANCAVTHEFPHILCKPEVHYLVHNSPTFAPILSQSNPVHTTPSSLSKIHFNIIAHLRLGRPNDPFPYSPAGSVLLLSHLTSCTPAKSNLFRFLNKILKHTKENCRSILLKILYTVET